MDVIHTTSKGKMLDTMDIYFKYRSLYTYGLITSANRIKLDLEGQYNFIYSVGSNSVRTHWMYQCYGLYLAWWWLNEPKHVAEFLIFNIDYRCMLCHWRNKFTIISQNTTGWLLSKTTVVCYCHALLHGRPVTVDCYRLLSVAVDRHHHALIHGRPCTIDCYRLLSVAVDHHHALLHGRPITIDFYRLLSVAGYRQRHTLVHVFSLRFFLYSLFKPSGNIMYRNAATYSAVLYSMLIYFSFNPVSMPRGVLQDVSRCAAIVWAVFMLTWVTAFRFVCSVSVCLLFIRWILQRKLFYAHF